MPVDFRTGEIGITHAVEFPLLVLFSREGKKGVSVFEISTAEEKPEEVLW